MALLLNYLGFGAIMVGLLAFPLESSPKTVQGLLPGSLLISAASHTPSISGTFLGCLCLGTTECSVSDM